MLFWNRHKIFLIDTAKLPKFRKILDSIILHSVSGAIAQLGERLHGMQEVGGSIPPGSTKSP